MKDFTESRNEMAGNIKSVGKTSVAPGGHPTKKTGLEDINEKGQLTG